MRANLVDATSPIAYGYGENLSVYVSEGLIFNIGNTLAGRGRRPPAGETDRPTGRGTVDDPDQPQGRPPAKDVPEEPKAEPWQPCRSPTNSCAIPST